MYYLVCLAVVIAALFYYRKFYARAQTATGNKDQNPYLQLRQMAFKVTAAELNLTLTHAAVYGLVIDIPVNQARATLVAYRTGDASLYLSNGSSIIGGGQHRHINAISLALVTDAQNYLSHTTLTQHTNPAGNQAIHFYLLTGNGVFTASAVIDEMQNGTSPLTQLFAQANHLLTELRLLSQKQ